VFVIFKNQRYKEGVNMRLEKDSIGNVYIEDEAYYGIQSLRGAINFNVTETRINLDFVKNMARIKKAAAIVNNQVGTLSKEKCDAIVKASEEVSEGKLYDAFIVDIIQGGAGTSSNMNANEVIANRAIELLGGKKGDYSIVHPNDDVNMAQSTNDVIPTAAKMTVIDLMRPLQKNLKKLEEAFLMKAEEFNDIIKMGRTQMQDAVPIRLGQEFKAYAAAIKRDRERIALAEKDMHIINMGGSAIGTSINVDPVYLGNIAKELSNVCGYELTLAEDLIDSTQNLDCFVNVSSSLKTCVVNLAKIAGDLRLLSSGPRTGFGEINLPSMQNGSSIMPGKINPVIPEVVSQVAFLIMGHDVTINFAAANGQLELNAFGPVLYYQLFESIFALNGAAESFAKDCVEGITANIDTCKENVEKSVGIITVLVPVIGYQKAAEIAKEALKTGVPVRELILRDKILNEEELDKILDPYKMTSI
jgi:aspartate ammonia-lyase